MKDLANMGFEDDGFSEEIVNEDTLLSELQEENSSQKKVLLENGDLIKNMMARIDSSSSEYNLNIELLHMQHINNIPLTF